MTTISSPLSPGLLVETSAACIHCVTPTARLSLRARGDLSPLEQALGLSIPQKIGQRASVGDIEMLCIGPDEWTIVASNAEPIVSACGAIYETSPHSLVDISGREVTLEIKGSQATELLTIGMPRNPDSIATGEGRRVAFDGMSVVLWRDAEQSYRMDIWNSFATHLFHLLETGCREFAAETGALQG